MDYLFVGSVVVALIAITFLLLIFMPTPNCFFSFESIGESMDELNSDTFKKIVEEVHTTYDNNGVRMLYQNGQLHKNMESHPVLYDMLLTVPHLERAFLKHITKKTKSPKQKGSANTSNKSLRCILPIDIPAAKKSGIWVDGEKKFFSDGIWVIYDNSRESSYYNKHKRLDLYILVVDVSRPVSIPMGIAVDDHDVLF